MERACFKCGTLNAEATFKPNEACPTCGAIYSKVTESRNDTSSPVSVVAGVRKSTPKRKRGNLVLPSLLAAIVVALVASWLLGSVHDKTGAELGVAQQSVYAPLESDARVTCAREIERLAKWSFEWTDSILGSQRFPSIKHVTGSSGAIPAIALAGDQIKMQNGFGAWARMKYFCIYDPATAAASASVEPFAL